LLSNKKILSVVILLSLVLFSCGGNKSKEERAKLENSYNDPSFVLSQAKRVLGDSVLTAFKGRFDQDSVIEVVAGTEISNKSEWGIRFYFLKLQGDDLVKVAQTALLQGSFKGSLCNKIKFPSFNHELIYYNSRDYFLGSAGGEIFSYIINFQENKTYYAHLVADENKPNVLFISENIDVPEIKNFFILNFKRDYPKISLSSKDVRLKF